MVRSKQASKSKKPSRGVDFKKIKKKLGRKLPPPRNATDTQVKSKAIVLPEQSVASDRAGMAVNKKGLTLRELLQQTSHHNDKIRRAALNGIRDLLLKHPLELKQHKAAIIEKLRERICDSDRVVRESLYLLLKTVILPSLREDIAASIVSLMMAYIFNAMTHIAIDIRLMAFKFFELIVLSCPTSFFMYADKVLDNYIDVFKNSQIYLQDKNRFRNALSGLNQCLSLLNDEKKEGTPTPDTLISFQSSVVQRCLHAFEAVQKADSGASVVDKMQDLVPVLLICFQESMLPLRSSHEIDKLSSDCILSTLQTTCLAVKVYVHQMRVAASMSTAHDNISRMTVNLKKLWEVFPMGELHHSMQKANDLYLILNVRITEIFFHLIEWIADGMLKMEKFLFFLENLLLGQVGTRTNQGFVDKQLIVLVPFVPRLVSKVTMEWKIRLLEAFSTAFKNCRVESKLSLACISAIEEMLLPLRDEAATSSESFDMYITYQIAWMHELPRFLLELGEKNPSASKVILNLQLRVGQCLPQNSHLSFEYDQLQWPLKEFYKSQTKSQSTNIDPHVLLRIIEVLHSAYKAGHLKISDHISFLITLVLRFQIHPERLAVRPSDGQTSNQEVFKAVVYDVCSCVSQMGDNSLAVKLVCSSAADEFKNLPLENMRGLLIIIFTLYFNRAKLVEEEIQRISCWVSCYLMLAATDATGTAAVTNDFDQIHIFQYFARPCMIFFYQSEKFLTHVLMKLVSQNSDYASFASHSSPDPSLGVLTRLLAIITILVCMYNDVKLQRGLSSNKETIRKCLGSIRKLLVSSNFTLEEKHRAESAFDQLKSRAYRLHKWTESDLA